MKKTACTITILVLGKRVFSNQDISFQKLDCVLCAFFVVLVIPFRLWLTSQNILFFRYR